MPWVTDKVHILTEDELKEVLNDVLLREKIERAAHLLRKIMELESNNLR